MGMWHKLEIRKRETKNMLGPPLKMKEWGDVTYMYCINSAIRDKIRDINNFVLNGSISVSYYHITLMSLMQLYAIAFPLRYMNLSKKKVIILIVAIWVLSLGVIASLTIYAYNDPFNPPGPDDFHDQSSVYLINFIMTLLLPYMITVLSVTLLCIVHFRYKQLNITVLST